jgi:hypothetical protein
MAAPSWNSQRPVAYESARNSRPFIDERAATRGRIATEGGDEHAGVKRAIIRSISGLVNRTARRRSTPERPAANDATRDAHADRYACPPPSPATMRRSSAIAPQRAGAAQRKGGEPAGLNSGHPFERHLATARGERRPGTRTLELHPSAFVDGNDAPLIGERRAARAGHEAGWRATARSRQLRVARRNARAQRNGGGR